MPNRLVNLSVSEQNKYSSTNSTLESITRYWDGSLWQDIIPGGTYYVQISALDISGNRSTVNLAPATVGQARTNDIEDISITNAKIYDLVVDKITSGFLSAVVTVSGTIRTGTTGARMEMDNTGMIGYASDGSTKNFWYKNSDGSIAMKGSLTSGSDITGATITGSQFQTNLTPTTNGIIIEDTNGLRAFEGGVLNSQIDRQGYAYFKKIEINGNTTAGGGSVLTLKGGASANQIFQIDENGVFMGASTYAGAPFKINYDGVVQATNMNLVEIPNGGNLTLNGDINLLTSTGTIYLGSTTGSRVEMNQSGIHAFNLTTETFHLDATDGSLTMIGAISTGGAIAGGTIDIGTNPNAFHVDNLGNMWLGNAVFASAPFSVTNAGTALMKNVLITGANMAANDYVIQTPAFSVQADGDIIGSSVSFTGGTIGGTTITATELQGGIISGSTFNVGNGGSINFNGSGNMSWTPAATGGITVSNSGYIQSADYDGPTKKGWRLANGGLEIYEGVVIANSLQIGISNTNLVKNAAFTEGTSVSSNWTMLGTGTFTVTTEQYIFFGESQKAQVTAASAAIGVEQTVTRVDGESFKSGDVISVSFYGRQANGTLRGMDALVYSDINTLYNGTDVALIALNSWKRYTFVFELNADTAHLRIQLRFLNPAIGEAFFFDGAQLQVSDFPTDFIPAPLEIPSNYIQSAHINTLTATKLTAGTIGSHLIELNGASSIIQSSTFGSSSGWQIKGDGTAIFEGSVTVSGAGGTVVLDQNGLTLTDGVLGTVFLMDQTGVYIGGVNTSDAGFYYDIASDKAVFQSTAPGGHSFTIDTTPDVDGKIVRLNNNGGPDTFYIKSDGLAYFDGGVIQGTTIASGTLSASALAASSLTNVIDLDPGGLQFLGLGGKFVLDGLGLRFWDNPTGAGDPSIHLEALTGESTFTGRVSIAEDAVVNNTNHASGLTVTGTGGSSVVPTDGAKVIGSPYYTFGIGSQGTGAESAYMQLDFSAPIDIAMIKTHWYTGDDRYYWYKIKYSLNGTTWYYARGDVGSTSWVTSTKRLGTTGEQQTIDRFEPRIYARYVRIYADGNNMSTGNNLYEIEFYSRTSDDYLTVGQNFRVNAQGDMFANSGTFSGSIDIGGVDATSFHVDTAGNMWLGSSAYSTGAFKVSSAGNVYIENAGDLYLNGGGIMIGSNTGAENNVIRNSNNTFRVSATSATLTAGNISGVTITGSTLATSASAGGSWMEIVPGVINMHGDDWANELAPASIFASEFYATDPTGWRFALSMVPPKRLNTDELNRLSVYSSTADPEQHGVLVTGTGIRLTETGALRIGWSTFGEYANMTATTLSIKNLDSPTTTLTVNDHLQVNGNVYSTGTVQTSALASAGTEVVVYDHFKVQQSSVNRLYTTGAATVEQTVVERELIVSDSGSTKFATLDGYAKTYAQAGWGTVEHISWNYVTSTTTGSGVATAVHGLASGHQRIIWAQCGYKNTAGSNEYKAMTLNYIDGSNIQFTGGLASVPYRMAWAFVRNTPAW